MKMKWWKISNFCNKVLTVLLKVVIKCIADVEHVRYRPTVYELKYSKLCCKAKFNAF